MSIYRRKTSAGKSKFLTAEFMHRGQIVRRSGFPDRESAKHWLQTESIRLRRSAHGYIKPIVSAQVVPLINTFTLTSKKWILRQNTGFISVIRRFVAALSDFRFHLTSFSFPLFFGGEYHHFSHTYTTLSRRIRPGRGK
jgi:hypothetical protein